MTKKKKARYEKVELEKAKLAEVKKYLEAVQTQQENIQEYYIDRRKSSHGDIIKAISKAFMAVVLTTSIIGGVVLVFGGGIPFYPDKFKQRGLHKAEFDNEKGYTCEVKYERAYWTGASTLPTSIVTAQTPWEKTETGEYKQTRYDYSVNTNYQSIINMLLNSEYEQLMNVLDKTNEVTVFKNNISEEELNADYEINAKLFYFDKEYLYFEESPGWNIGGGIVQTVITLVCILLWIGSLETARDVGNELDRLKRLKKDYYNRLNELVSELKANYDAKVIGVSMNGTSNMLLKKEVEDLYLKLTLGGGQNER